MYLTAQHVRNDAGEEDLHVFLHLHGPDSGALNDPWSVPHVNPGRLVPDSLPRRIAPGGNSVLSYLDIIADDAIGAAVLPDAGAPPQPWWESALASVSKNMSGEPLPWVVSLAGIHVIFCVYWAVGHSEAGHAEVGGSGGSCLDGSLSSARSTRSKRRPCRWDRRTCPGRFPCR
jgi:hypothetical protein